MEKLADLADLTVLADLCPTMHFRDISHKGPSIAYYILYIAFIEKSIILLLSFSTEST